MASNPDDQNGVTRREFTAYVGAAAAGIVGAGGILGASARTAASTSRILGANDRVVISQIGVRGQGNSLKRGFAQLKNVEIKTLCDIDANLAPSRINDDRLKDVATFKPNFVQDLRRVLDDKEIDAVTIAIPNHWHALATIWASRRASTSTSRSRRRTPCGKAAAWWKRPTGSRRSCRSAR